MNLFQNGRLWLGFLIPFLAVGLPYWLLPYNRVNVPDALLTPGLALVVFAALVLCACRLTSFWKATWIAAATVPAVVMTRVLVEGLMDPTSHNLWPLELIIALPVGFVPAVAGAIVGSLFARLLADR